MLTLPVALSLRDPPGLKRLHGVGTAQIINIDARHAD